MVDIISSSLPNYVLDTQYWIVVFLTLSLGIDLVGCYDVLYRNCQAILF